MVFKSFSKKSSGALFLGSPEAEAESLPTSKVMLHNVYQDHHNLFTELSNEKFIVVGRKGCGKSAFAEYAHALSQDEANLFTSFIRQDTVSMEALVQLGHVEGQEQNSKEHLFKWLIYTHILTLFFNNEAANQSTQFKLLKEFLKKNSGYIDIDKGEIIELIKKHKFEVSIEQFKRFFKGKYGQDIQIKESRAPYYKLLPHLEKVVVSVLSSNANVDNENSYVVFFDDLDIGFNSDNPESVDTVINLLRTAKYVNNNVFAKNHTSAKAIILIRDDVERLLSPMGADIAKIFSSYSVSLDWYQEEYLSKHKENELGLKKLIEKRAKNAFEVAGIKMKKQSAWESLVTDSFHPKSSFKYICDHTYLRPRDLILFFKPLETGRYSLPLTKHSVNSLLGQYASELVKELSNELSSFYTPVQIQNIFDSLREIHRQYNCTYFQAVNIIKKNCDIPSAENLLDDLFARSLIGTIERDNGFVKFRHKTSKKDAGEYNLNKDGYLIVHTGLNVYLQNR
jgi:NOL1/NOP2/fmu family ribosome biogenesis protein